MSNMREPFLRVLFFLISCEFARRMASLFAQNCAMKPWSVSEYRLLRGGGSALDLKWDPRPTCLYRSPSLVWHFHHVDRCLAVSMAILHLNGSNSSYFPSAAMLKAASNQDKSIRSLADPTFGNCIHLACCWTERPAGSHTSKWTKKKSLWSSDYHLVLSLFSTCNNIHITHMSGKGKKGKFSLVRCALFETN